MKSPRPLVSACPDVDCYDLLHGRDAFFVLASDGVWDVMSDDDVVSLIINRSVTYGREKDGACTFVCLHLRAFVCFGLILHLAYLRVVYLSLCFRNAEVVAEESDGGSEKGPSSDPGLMCHPNFTATDAAKLVVDTAYDRGSEDNITAVVVNLVWAPHDAGVATTTTTTTSTATSE